MSVLKGREAEAFVRRRDPRIAVVLLHGSDLGLIRDRAGAIGRQVVEDLQDPFNAVELGEADLHGTPGRLADEAAALSFMGGERLVRIRHGSDAAGKAVTAYLKGLEGGHFQSNALVIVEGGQLTKSNALRKACEASKLAVAIGCYPDQGRDLMETIRAQLSESGHDIEDDALALLVSRLGEDRGLTRSEVEKIALYKGKQKGRIGIKDVRVCLADDAADTTFDVIAHTLSGKPKDLAAALHAARTAGVSPIAILRILQGKMMRLLEGRTLIEDGMAPQAAAKKAAGTPLFTEQRLFQDQLSRWPRSAIDAGLRDVFEADLDAKRTGMPQDELIERTLFRLAVGAARRG